MAAEANTIVTTDLEPAISIDHNERLVTGIKSLMTVLGITELTAMPAGVTVNQYKMGRKGNAPAQVAEGDEIKLTEYERKLANTYSLVLEKYRKRSTAEAIQKVGRDLAVNKTDDLLIKEVQKSIKSKFYTFLKNGTGTAPAGANLQGALAGLWTAINTYAPYEDGDFTPVYFVNPADIGEYLKTAAITVQTTFGFSYVENFLGLGLVVIDNSVTAKAPQATVAENLNGVYIPTNGDVGQTFGLTSDATGLVGMKHFLVDGRASIDTLVMSGVTFYPEDVTGIFKGSISAGA